MARLRGADKRPAVQVASNAARKEGGHMSEKAWDAVRTVLVVSLLLWALWLLAVALDPGGPDVSPY